MTFPIELEKLEKGLIFKLREGEPIVVEAKPLGEPFDMTFEDRAHGAGDWYGGKPEERYGNFGEQMDVEIEERGLSPEVANAYLAIGSEEEISKGTTIRGNHLPIERPRIARQKIQLYSIEEEVAKAQRGFTGALVMAWTT